MEPITKVQYRKFKGEIIAVFPYVINDNKGNVLSYSHIGQHSGCAWDINSASYPVSEDEYKPLHNELLSCGYNLRVIKRRSHSEYLEAYYASLNKR